MDGAIIITGGLGDIGLAVARAFAAQGHRLVLFDNDLRRAGSVTGEPGGQANIFQVDVRIAGEVESAVRQAVEVAGPIGALVNCAGVIRWTPTVEISEAEWDFVLDINLKGTFLVCQQVARQMLQAGRGGRIVNLSSGLATRPNPELAHYAASKAGIIALSKVLAQELGPHGINVNCVAPGMVDTQLIAGKRNAGDIQGYAARTPLGVVMKPEDIAEVVLFLCGPQSHMLTGQTIYVNGGGLMP